MRKERQKATDKQIKGKVLNLKNGKVFKINLENC
jgi:uncharacterized protein (DUF2147 family)